jgi:hypothetical protein
MPRPLRIEYAGAVYHVMARGNQGWPIFADNRDRRLWLDTLAESCQKTGWRIHAYVKGWLAERLGMGHESRVSQAVGRMKKRPGRRLARFGRVLEKLEAGDGRK